jgi:hypothetical protein
MTFCGELAAEIYQNVRARRGRETIDRETPCLQLQVTGEAALLTFAGRYLLPARQPSQRIESAVERIEGTLQLVSPLCCYPEQSTGKAECAA